MCLQKSTVFCIICQLHRLATCVAWINIHVLLLWAQGQDDANIPKQTFTTAFKYLVVSQTLKQLVIAVPCKVKSTKRIFTCVFYINMHVHWIVRCSIITCVNCSVNTYVHLSACCSARLRMRARACVCVLSLIHI